MKQLHRANRKIQAMTLVEVLVVGLVLAFVTALLLPALAPAHRHSGISCVNNLKQIGLSYQLWAGDNSDKYPMGVSVTNGGAMELMATGNVAAIFQVMSNELSTPKILCCPNDAAHFFATNFTINFSARNLSYFVGMNVTNASNPQMMLSGDDNFEIHGVPVKAGRLEISSNTEIAWSDDRHNGAGNIGLADGSVQQMTSHGLRDYLSSAVNDTNYLGVP